jgi:hypothetical protein
MVSRFSFAHLRGLGGQDFAKLRHYPEGVSVRDACLAKKAAAMQFGKADFSATDPNTSVI